MPVLDPAREDGDRMGVIIGSGIGGMHTYESQLRVLAERGPAQGVAIHHPFAHRQHVCRPDRHRRRCSRTQLRPRLRLRLRHGTRWARRRTASAVAKPT